MVMVTLRLMARWEFLVPSSGAFPSPAHGDHSGKWVTLGGVVFLLLRVGGSSPLDRPPSCASRLSTAHWGKESLGLWECLGSAQDNL